MKTAAITRLLLVLLGAPELLHGRAIPSKGLEQRFVDLNPTLNATELNHCGTARCHALGVVVTKRAGVPVAGGAAAGKGAGAAAGELGAGRAAGEAAGGASAGRAGSGSSAGGGDASSGAQTGGQLGDFGTGQSSTGKRPLDSGSEGSSPDPQPDPKIPKTGTDAAAADDAIAGDAAAGSAADATSVTDIKSKGYNPVKTELPNNVDEYEVKVGEQVIDKIRVDKNQKTIIADDLRNADDPTTDRFKSWQVEMSVFVHESGQSPSDLNGVLFSSVEESINTETTLARIVDSRPDSNGAFTLERDSTNVNDQNDFADLKGTVLGRSAQHILDNNPVGKEITRIEVAPGEGEAFDLNVFFG